jgi:hypothetical protein
MTWRNMLKRRGAHRERIGTTVYHDLRFTNHGGMPVRLTIFQRPNSLKIEIDGGFQERPLQALIEALLTPVA